MPPSIHFCKWCASDFLAHTPAGTADVFLICPGCKWKHYRRFEGGIAVHCDIAKRDAEPIEIKGHRP